MFVVLCYLVGYLALGVLAILCFAFVSETVRDMIRDFGTPRLSFFSFLAWPLFLFGCLMHDLGSVLRSGRVSAFLSRLVDEIEEALDENRSH